MNTQIGQYLQKRITKNHHAYHRQITHHSNITKTDEVIFELLYLMVIQALKEGHTVVRLTSKNWQAQIIAVIKDHIYDELGFKVDFDEIFIHIEVLSHDSIQIKSYIDQIMQEIEAEYQKQQMLNPTKKRNQIESKQFIERMLNTCKQLMRFYYFQHKKGGSLSALIDVIQSHVFFGHQNHHQDRPMIWDIHQNDLYFWLNRIYRAELSLLLGLSRLYHTPMDKMTPPKISSTLNTAQIKAVQSIFKNPISIITGGPGTGKTSTVAQAVLALSGQQGFKLALVAPTGKASQRMSESLQYVLKDTYVDLPEPMTIHRLLGIGLDGVARHNKNHPLPFDLVIVDEASMIGVELANQLINAMKRGSRLVLLGDTHQLFAVEAGSVLSDLCDIDFMKNSRVHLAQSHRFKQDSGVGQLANLVNEPHHQTYQKMIDVIGQYSELSYQDISIYRDKNMNDFYDLIAHDYCHDASGYFQITKQTKHQFYQLCESSQKQCLKQLHETFNQYRILCASHLSIWGDEAINRHIKKQHQQYLDVPLRVAQHTDWYHGRPVMILKNRYDLGLFNGDIGICLQYSKRANELAVFFYGEPIKHFPVSMLTSDMVSTAYAMTIHKSQGSEFDKVAVVCHDVNERLLSKELLYTAITRAKTQVDLYATPKALMYSVNHPTNRLTGLTLHEGRVLTDSEI